MSTRNLLSREVGILLESNSSKEYKWLFKYLEFGKPFNPNNAGMTENEKSIYENNIEYIITTASTEWILRDERPFDDLEEKRTTCRVCGNNRNKLVFWIKNQITGKEINIGSECRTHFGIKGGVPIAQLIREEQKNKQRARLVNRIPDITSKAVYWKDELIQQAVVIPENLAKPFLDICRKINVDYENYINGKELPSQKLIDSFNALISEGNEKMSNINKYVENVKIDHTIATRKVWRWLKYRKTDEGSKIAICNIEKTGKISWNHVWRIAELEFMKLLLLKVNELISNTNIQFIGIDSGSDRDGRYVVEIVAISGNKIKISCKHEEIFLNAGDMLLGEEPIEEKVLKDVIIGAGVIYSDIDNEQVLEILKGSLNIRIILVPKYDNEETKQIAVFDNKIKLYALIDRAVLANSLVAFALGIKDESKAIKDIQKLRVRWIAEDDLKERQSMAELMKNKY